MITFTNISGGKICILTDYETNKYFYHVKARVLGKNYCHCTIMLDIDIINDIYETKNYKDKNLTIVYTPIYYGLINLMKYQVDDSFHLLEQNPEEIIWKLTYNNLEAIHLIEKYPEKIDWGQLSNNPNAIHLLEQNPEKINWWWLSGNPNAIHLLEQNQ